MSALPFPMSFDLPDGWVPVPGEHTESGPLVTIVPEADSAAGYRPRITLRTSQDSAAGNVPGVEVACEDAYDELRAATPTAQRQQHDVLLDQGMPLANQVVDLTTQTTGGEFRLRRVDTFLEVTGPEVTGPEVTGPPVTGEPAPRRVVHFSLTAERDELAAVMPAFEQFVLGTRFNVPEAAPQAATEAAAAPARRPSVNDLERHPRVAQPLEQQVTHGDRRSHLARRLGG